MCINCVPVADGIEEIGSSRDWAGTAEIWLIVVEERWYDVLPYTLNDGQVTARI